MSERTINFTFNTAISDVDPQTGRLNEDAQGNLVRPLLARIKQIDGVYFCYIARYGMEVKYIVEATNVETLEREINAAVEWAATQEGFFPKRGNKTPRAILEQSKSPMRKVVVQFGTHCLAYPVNALGKYDSATFKHKTQALAARLADTDGIVDCTVELNGAILEYDSRITDHGRVTEHIETVLDETLDDDFNFDVEEVFFPYVRNGYSDLSLRFS